eukprot:12538958-Heterocapsa_arctica.AAC.1
MESTDNEHRSTDNEETDTPPESLLHGFEWTVGEGETQHMQSQGDTGAKGEAEQWNTWATNPDAEAA